MTDKDKYQGFVEDNYLLLVEDLVEMYRDEFDKFCDAAFIDYDADKADALRDAEREKDVLQ